MEKIANVISSILQGPGKLMGDAANDIPLGIFGAKGIFMAYFLFLMYMVIQLPRDEVCFTNEDTGKEVNLRPYSIVSLTLIIIIYAVF
jgi:hypothetical protein